MGRKVIYAFGIVLVILSVVYHLRSIPWYMDIIHIASAFAIWEGMHEADKHGWHTALIATGGFFAFVLATVGYTLIYFLY